MKTLLWLGAPFFARSMQAVLDSGEFDAGHDWQVRIDVAHEPRVQDWDEVVDAAGGVEPDVVVLGDNSCPPALLGVERFPSLTVFYDVDSHIHEWHQLYAQSFDLCMVSLGGHVDSFGVGRLAKRTLWSPPFAKDTDRAMCGDGDVPEWDVAFVGNVNKDLSPGRHEFLEHLGAKLALDSISLEIRRGDYRKLFPRARIVLNEAERGDLNFRVFEAIACGSCLLTPRVGHGLEELFEPGRELALYEPGDAEDAARVIRSLLGDPEKAGAMARAGLARVDREHRATHRARSFLRWLFSFDHTALVAERRALAPALLSEVSRPLLLHWAQSLSGTSMASRYLAAVRRVSD